MNSNNACTKFTVRRTNFMSQSLTSTRQINLYDYRCEFDIPKFCDLNNVEEDKRFSSVTTQRPISTQQRITDSIEKDMSPREKRKKSIADDPYFDWFQQFHDFKIKPPQIQNRGSNKHLDFAYQKRNTQSFQKNELNNSLNLFKRNNKKRKAEEAKIQNQQDKSQENQQHKKLKLNDHQDQQEKVIALKKQLSTSKDEQICQENKAIITKKVNPKINYIEKNKKKVREMSDNSQRIKPNKILHQVTHQENSNQDSQSQVPEVGDILKQKTFQGNSAFKKIRPKTQQSKQNQETVQKKSNFTNLTSTNQTLSENFNHLNIINQNQNYQGKQKLMHSSTNKFLYEPTMFSSRIIRKWQQMTGKNWYKMSPASRKYVNQEIQDLANQQNQISQLNHSAFIQVKPSVQLKHNTSVKSLTNSFSY